MALVTTGALLVGGVVWWRSAHDPYRVTRTDEAVASRRGMDDALARRLADVLDGREALAAASLDSCTVSNTGWWADGPETVNCTIGRAAVLPLTAPGLQGARQEAQGLLGDRCAVAAAGVVVEVGRVRCRDVSYTLVDGSSASARELSAAPPGVVGHVVSGSRLDGERVLAAAEERGVRWLLLVDALGAYLAEPA